MIRTEEGGRSMIRFQQNKWPMFEATQYQRINVQEITDGERQKEISKTKRLYKIHNDIVKEIYGDANEKPIKLTIPAELNAKILNYLQHNEEAIEGNELRKKLQESKTRYMWTSGIKDKEEIEKNISNTPFRWEMHPFSEAVQEIVAFIKNKLSGYYKSPVSVMNITAKLVTPGASLYGMCKPHRDGFPEGCTKVLIYPQGLDKEKGLLEIEGATVEGPPGLLVAFNSSKYIHRAIPGLSENRLAIEISLMRSITPLRQLMSSHAAGSFYIDPKIPYQFEQSRNKYPERYKEKENPFKYINIGSGGKVNTKWLSLDELDHPLIFRTKICPEFVLPADSKSINIVYTSHHLEHQNDECIDKILSETSRCLSSKGYFVLKLPNFEDWINAYVKKDISRFPESVAKSISWSWKNKNLEYTFANRLAYCISGYWNHAYGDHYTQRINYNDPNAYNGPAVIPHNDLDKLLKTKDLRKISKVLNQEATKDPDFKNFNHQNAWDHKYIIDLVESKGLKLISTDTSKIIKFFSDHIIDIKNLREQSAYYLFKQSI